MNTITIMKKNNLRLKIYYDDTYVYDFESLGILKEDLQDDDIILAVDSFTEMHRGEKIQVYATKRTQELTGVKDEDIKHALACDKDMFKRIYEGEVYGFTVEKVTTCHCCNQEVCNIVESILGFIGIENIVSEIISMFPEFEDKLKKELL